MNLSFVCTNVSIITTFLPNIHKANDGILRSILEDIFGNTLDDFIAMIV